jgi:hypothetical protein
MSGDDDAVFVAAGELEGAAVVVEFVLVLPAHAVAALAFGGVLPVREADGFLGHGTRCGARITQPVWPVQCSTCRGRRRFPAGTGIAGVAEDAFDEIQIAHHVAGREEADLHRVFKSVGCMGRAGVLTRRWGIGARRGGPYPGVRQDSRKGTAGTKNPADPTGFGRSGRRPRLSAGRRAVLRGKRRRPGTGLAG